MEPKNHKHYELMKLWGWDEDKMRVEIARAQIKSAALNQVYSDENYKDNPQALHERTKELKKLGYVD